MGKLTEAYAAYAILTKIGMGSTADLTSVMLPR